jgi:hypothetical protein
MEPDISRLQLGKSAAAPIRPRIPTLTISYSNTERTRRLWGEDSEWSQRRLQFVVWRMAGTGTEHFVLTA